MGARQVGPRLPELPEKIRAFIAIRLALEVERTIDDLVAQLRSHDDAIKWVSSANLHLTLKFLGPSVPLAKIHRITKELELIAAATDPFELEAAHVGGFPDLKHPQVLWVGLRSDALSALAANIDEGASRCGFEREQRSFRGHLTIARLQNVRLHPETRVRIEAVSKRTFGTSTIRAMTLYRSITKSTGTVYEALHDFKFNP